jgi:hypothetical protein
VNNVGIVYNFKHAHDDVHDDSANFPEIWNKIKPYVVAVNITGIQKNGTRVYPSQGDRELDMLRTIAASRWHGPIGVITENGSDAEVSLRKALTGFNWLAAEVANPGSGGARPVLPKP